MVRYGMRNLRKCPFMIDNMYDGVRKGVKNEEI